MSKLRRPPGVWLGPARVGAHGHPQKNVAGAVERRRAVKWQRWLDQRLVAEGLAEYREDHPERLPTPRWVFALRRHLRPVLAIPNPEIRWTYCDAPTPEDVKQAWLRGYIAPPGGEPFPTVEEFARWEDIPDAPWVVEAEEQARWAEFDAFCEEMERIERQMPPNLVWAYDLNAWHHRKMAA